MNNRKTNNRPSYHFSNYSMNSHISVSNSSYQPIRKKAEISKSVSSSHCNCKKRQCTYSKSSRDYICQHWYHCETCFPGDNIRGCCDECAKVCHKGHQLIDMGKAQFFCDCGAGDGKFPCKLMPSNETLPTLTKPIEETLPSFVEKPQTPPKPTNDDEESIISRVKTILPSLEKDMTFLTQVGCPIKIWE